MKPKPSTSRNHRRSFSRSRIARSSASSAHHQATGMSPFAVVYQKVPATTVDLIKLPKGFKKSKAADLLAQQHVDIIPDFKKQLELVGAKSKVTVDKHRRMKLFQVGDLVLVYLRKERGGGHRKLDPRKIGPFKISQKINDNAYVLDLPDHMKIFKMFNNADLYPYYPDAPSGSACLSKWKGLMR